MDGISYRQTLIPSITLQAPILIALSSMGKVRFGVKELTLPELPMSLEADRLSTDSPCQMVAVR